MNTVKVLKFLATNVFLVYLSVLFYENFIWIGRAFSAGDAMEATNLSFVIMFIVILNSIDFVTEILDEEKS